MTLAAGLVLSGRHSRGSRVRRLAVGVALLAAAGPAAAQTRYTVTNLGTFTGTPTSSSMGFAVNNSGMVTGWSTTAVQFEEHAFRSSAAGEALTLTDLGTFGGLQSVGYAINDLGMVAGASSSDASNVLHAFRSPAAGTAGPLTDLGTFGGPKSLGLGINSSGVVAGGALDDQYRSIAFRSEASGASGPLTNPIAPFGGEGLAINDRGMVAGVYLLNPAFGITHAFRSPATGDGTRRTDLGTLGSSNLNSTATGINASGATSGYSETNGGGTHAFRSSAVGETVALTDLGTLGSGANSFGQGINGSGLVVGYSEYDATRQVRAFVYDTRMHDLNALVDNLSAAGFRELNIAYGVSDTGFITGFGTTLDGSTRAFLLTPVVPTPEPGTVLGVGAVGLGLAGWFRRRAAAQTT